MALASDSVSATGARPKRSDSLKTGNTGDFYEACVALDCFYNVLKSFRRDKEAEEESEEEGGGGEDDGKRNLLNLADFKFGLQLQADAKKFDDIVVGFKLKGQEDNGFNYYVIQIKNDNRPDHNDPLDVKKMKLKDHFEGYLSIRKRLKLKESNLSDGTILKVVWLGDYTGGIHFKKLKDNLPLKSCQEPMLKSLLPETIGTSSVCQQIDSSKANLECKELKDCFGSGSDDQIRDFFDHLLIVTSCTGIDQLEEKLQAHLTKEGVDGCLQQQMAKFKRDKSMLWLTPNNICNRTIIFQGKDFDLSTDNESIFKGLSKTISGKGLLQLYCRSDPVNVGQVLEKPDLPNKIFLPRRLQCLSSGRELEDITGLMTPESLDKGNHGSLVVITSPADTGKSILMEEIAYRVKGNEEGKLWIVKLSLKGLEQNPNNVKEILMQQVNDDFEKALLTVARHRVILMIDDLEYALYDSTKTWNLDLDKFVESFNELKFGQIWLAARQQMYAYILSKCDKKKAFSYTLLPPNQTEIVTYIEKAHQAMMETSGEDDSTVRLTREDIYKRVGHLLPDKSGRPKGVMTHLPAYLSILTEVLFDLRLDDTQLAKIDTEYILMERYITLRWQRHKDRTLGIIQNEDVIKAERVRFLQRHEMRAIMTLLGGRVKVGDYFAQNTVFPDNVLINDGLLHQGKHGPPFYNSAVFSYMAVQFLIKNIRDTVNWQTARETFIAMKRFPLRWLLLDRQLIQALAGGKEDFLIFQEGPEVSLKWFKEHYSTKSEQVAIMEKDFGGRTPLHLAASSIHQGPINEGKELLRFLIEILNSNTTDGPKQHLFRNRDKMNFSILDHVALSLFSLEFFAGGEQGCLLGHPTDKLWWAQAVRKIPHESHHLYVKENFVKLRAHLENVRVGEKRIFVLCAFIPNFGLSESTKQDIDKSFPHLPTHLIQGDAVMEFRSLLSAWNQKPPTVNGAHAIIIVPLVPCPIRKRHRSRHDPEPDSLEYNEHKIDWQASKPILEKLKQYVSLSGALSGEGHVNTVQHFPLSEAKMNSKDMGATMDEVFHPCNERWDKKFEFKGKGLKGERMKSLFNSGGLVVAGKLLQVDAMETNFDKYGYERWNLFTYANAFQVEQKEFEVDEEFLATSFEVQLPPPSISFQSVFPISVPIGSDEKIKLSEKDSD